MNSLAIEKNHFRGRPGFAATPLQGKRPDFAGHVKPNILSIQYLRGIAALMVVLVHVPVQLSRFGYDGKWPDFFASGVDIFFIISGLIMWVTSFHANITPRQFLWRRLIRVAPLYWVLTLLSVAILVLAPSMMQSGKFDWYHITSSLLFVSSIHPVTGDMQPVLVPGWTLNYEMFFYLIFAGCLFLPQKWRSVAIVASLSGVTILGLFVKDQNSVASFYCNSIVLEFGFGIAIGWLLTSGMKVHTALSVSSILIGIVGIALSSYIPAVRVIIFGIPAAFIVFGAVMFERSRPLRKSALLLYIGDTSYSLYLSHGLVLSALSQAWRKLHLADLPGSYAAFTLLALVVCVLASGLLFRFVERPLLNMSKPQTRLRPASQG